MKMWGYNFDITGKCEKVLCLFCIKKPVKYKETRLVL